MYVCIGAGGRGGGGFVLFSIFSKATIAVLLCSLQLSLSHLPLQCSFKGRGKVPVSADNVTLLLRGASILSKGLPFLIRWLTSLLYCFVVVEGEGVGSVSSRGRGVSMHPR